MEDPTIIAFLDKLDRLAAERIMGWHLGEDIDEDCQWFDSEDHPVYWDLGTYKVGSDEPWRPSRVIGQAWLCLEQITAQGIVASIIFNGREWNCDIPTKQLQTVAETPEMAILSACLKFHNVEF